MVGVSITKNTYLRYKRARNYFASYLLLTQKKKDITAEELNHFILDDFIDYLKKEKSYTHNSSLKLVQHIKTISEYCYKKGLLSIDFYERTNFKS